MKHITWHITWTWRRLDPFTSSIYVLARHQSAVQKRKQKKKRDKIYLSYFRIAGARTNRGWMEEIARGKRTIHTAEVESMSQEWRILERLKTTSQNILWVTAESFVVSINRKNMLYVNQRQNFRVHFSSVSTIALAYLRRTYIYDSDSKCIFALEIFEVLAVVAEALEFECETVVDLRFVVGVLVQWRASCECWITQKEILWRYKERKKS